MRYLNAYRFFFESPKWPLNLLAGSVCQLVPIVGPLVLTGYLLDVIATRLREGSDRFPPFDLNQLGTYLKRGLWPFLVSLAASIPFFILFVPLMFVFVLSAAAAERSGGSPGIMLGTFVLGGILIGILGFLIYFLSIPIMFRAGLSQDFVSAFSPEYVRGFISRVWKEMILSLLFIVVTAPFIFILGVLLLIVGIYPAIVILMAAQYHLQYQLYELYLLRGGTPIPISAS
jgi:hypothetical protein